MDLGFLSIAIGIFLGLASIAAGTFFGLKAFRTDISKKLLKISDKVISIHGTLEKAWDLIYSTLPKLMQKGGTVVIQLQNLGKTTIEAKPEIESTDYFITVERPVLKSGMIDKVAKETGFEEKEKQMLGGMSRILVMLPTMMKMQVPSNDPKVCTEYIVFFLKWLDSTYVNSLDTLEDFENPILKEFSKTKQ